MNEYDYSRLVDAACTAVRSPGDVLGPDVLTLRARIATGHLTPGDLPVAAWEDEMDHLDDGKGRFGYRWTTIYE